MTFADSLAHGQLGESVIAKWCMSRGNSVLPVYEKEIDTGKGPRFFTPSGQFVAPDMFVIPSMNWIEAKHKTVCSWYRNGKPSPYWCTGIDINHYEGYLQVEAISKRPVWLLFLHRSSTPDKGDIEHGCPKRCPVGLYGGPLSRLKLKEFESHRSPNWGRYGMVYWSIDVLTRLATLDEIEEVAA